MKIYHFIKGCKGEEQDYYFTDVVGNVEISNWYFAHYYRSKIGEEYGCFQYVGLEEHEPMLLTTLYIYSGPYDNCECAQSTHDIYEFVSCGDKPIVLHGQYVKYDGDIVQGEYYRISKYEDNCFVFNGIKQGTSTSTIEIQDGGFSDCDCEDKPSTEYMLFETCDGTLKFWKERDIFNDYEPDHYYSFGNMKYYYYCNPSDFPDFDFDNLTEEQFHIVINSDKVRLYANCFRFIGYTTEQPDSRYKKYPFQIFKSGECSDKAHNENNQYCEIFFECLISTCKGEEKHINLSNNIINLLKQNGYVTFKWNNKCYYIIEVIDEENPELPIMDIEHLNGIYPGCTECKNDGKQEGDTDYYEKINCEFASAVYDKAMAERYGVEFCCEKDLRRLAIKKKLLDAGQIQDDIDLCEL